MNRIAMIIGGFLILVILVLVFLGFFFKKTQPKTNNQIPIASSIPSITPYSTTQAPFKVIQTSPLINAQNVTPGELIVSFSTDVPLVSKNSFNLVFSPSLLSGFQITNKFPTQQVTVAVLGGLQPGTTYQVKVTNPQGQQVYTWSFTTSVNASGLSSSALHSQIEQDFNNQYYPLLDVTPYSSPDFDIDYTGRLTLTVRVKNPDLNRVKQEVNDWIRSHGVDPSTHTINFVNSQ